MMCDGTREKKKCGLIAVTESPNFRDGITSALLMIVPRT